MVERVAAPVATWVAEASSKPEATLYAIVSLIVWLSLAIPMHFSAAWALLVGIVLSIPSYVSGFAIQYTQKRESTAFHLKLDGQTRASDADDRLIGIEKLPDADVEDLRSKVCVINPT